MSGKNIQIFVAISIFWKQFFFVSCDFSIAFSRARYEVWGKAVYMRWIKARKSLNIISQMHANRITFIPVPAVMRLEQTKKHTSWRQTIFQIEFRIEFAVCWEYNSLVSAFRKFARACTHTHGMAFTNVPIPIHDRI